MPVRSIAPLVFASLILSGCGKAKDEIPPEYAQLSAAELFKQGMQAHTARDFKKSALLFRYTGIKDPSNHVAFFNRACALALLGNKDGAIDALRQASALNRTWVAQNLNDPDLAAVRQDPRLEPLAASGGTSAGPAGRKICRRATGPADTAQIEITLNPDHSVSGTGSRTGASVNLEFANGRWEEKGSSVSVALTFKGMAYGPEGQKQLTEQSTVSVERNDLLTYSGECLEIPTL